MFQQIALSWLPLVLLVVVWLAFGFYGQRKSSYMKTPLADEIQRPNDCITIVRRADPTNILRKYQVRIDGSIVGEVGAGEVLNCLVTDGTHAVSVQIDWCRTVDLKVEKYSSENLLLWCGAEYNDWRCSFMNIVRPRNYIYVRIE